MNNLYGDLKEPALPLCMHIQFVVALLLGYRQNTNYLEQQTHTATIKS